MNENELSIPDYALFRVDADNRHTGGVACYVHSSVKVDILDCFNQQSIWSMSFSILYGYSKETFCLIYRGHNSTKIDFEEFIGRTCEDLATNSSSFHLIGDFNYNFNDKTKSAKLISIFKSYNIKQVVDSPTHETGHSSTIIDWVVTNKKSLKPVVRNDCNIADHNFVVLDFFDRNASTQYTRNYTDWTKYSGKDLVTHLSSVDWSSFDLSKDVNLKFNFLNNALSRYLDNTLLIRPVKYNSSTKWFNFELSKLKSEKLQSKVRWNYSKSENDWRLYVKARNLYKNKLKTTEASFIQNELAINKNDPNKLWKTLKSIYSNNGKSELHTVQFHDMLETDANVICNKLNSHFVQTVEQLQSEIPIIDDNRTYSINSSPVKFSFSQVTHNTVQFYASEMKKKFYHDNVTGKVVLDALSNANFLISLTSLINESLSTGVVPDYCKISTVTPNQKVKGSINVNDLRPINTLCVIGQILERVVKDQLLEHFESNSLFAPQQSGFRKLHSCETSINSVLLDWKDSIDKDCVVIAVFIDLKRAFETIDRTLLLHKLFLYGCDDKVIAWFNSYFTDRYQQTRFGGIISDLLRVFIGISQGSVLSCILFNIFINDIVNVIQHSKIKLFADDTLIYIACKPEDLNTSIDLLNHDLSRIYKWLCYSKLTLNVEKSKAMLITSNKSLSMPRSIVINNEEIEMVSEFKYLGVTIDSSLSFSQHSVNILKKLNSKFYVLKRTEQKLNFESKKLYVSSLVMSHFHYCSTVLFLLNNTQLNDFQKVLNRFARLILKVDSRTHREDMLEELQWLTVKQTIYLNTIMFIHRIAIGISPAYLQQHMVKTKYFHDHLTRSNDDFKLKNYTTASSQNNLFYNGVKMYNNFIHFRKSRSTSTQSTKSLAIEYVKMNYPIE